MSSIDALLLKTNNRIKFRTVPKITAVMGKWQCRFYDTPKSAERQICGRFGRSGDKVVPVSWDWICEDCAREVKKVQDAKQYPP